MPIFFSFNRLLIIFSVLAFSSSGICQSKQGTYTETIEYCPDCFIYDQEFVSMNIEMSFVDSTHFYWKNIHYLSASEDSSVINSRFEVLQLNDTIIPIYRTAQSWVVLNRDYDQWHFTFIPLSQFEAVLEVYDDGFLVQSATNYSFYSFPFLQIIPISSNGKPYLLRPFDERFALYKELKGEGFVARSLINDAVLYSVDIDTIVELPPTSLTKKLGLVVQNGQKKILDFTTGEIQPYNVHASYRLDELVSYDHLLFIGDTFIAVEDEELGLQVYRVNQPRNFRIITENYEFEKRFVCLLFDHQEGLGTFFYNWEWDSNLMKLSCRKWNDSIVFLPVSDNFPLIEQLNLNTKSVHPIRYTEVKLLPSKKVFLAKTDHFYRLDSLNARILPDDWYIYSFSSEPIFCINYLKEQLSTTVSLDDWIQILEKQGLIILKNGEGKFGVIDLLGKTRIPFEYKEITFNDKKELFTLNTELRRYRLKLVDR